MEASPINILLVDDRKENLVALEAVLARPDYNLISVSSGPEGLSQLLKNEIALILLDAQMPEMDGFETARMIRGREKTRNVPIIIVTANYLDEHFIHQGYEAGAVDYITKPINPEILRAKVSVFAELFRKNKALQAQAEMITQERCSRIRAEALHEHYNSIMNGLDHSIIWEADTHLRFHFVSHRAQALLGYRHEEWFSKPNFFLDRIPSEERGEVEAFLRKVVEGGEDQRFEHRMIAADGKAAWYHTGIQCEQKPGTSEKMIQGLTVDITELKLSEEDLKKKATKYRRVIEANMLGHYFANIKTGKITEANECFLEMVGYSHEDLTQGAIRWNEMTPPEYRELDERGIRELQETGVCTPFEKEYIRKDGTRVPVMIGAARIEESKDECVCFALDLSDQRKAEEEKMRAVQAREEMLAIVSHDLKNPLSAILMNAVLLFKKIPPESDPSAIRKQVQVIQSAAEKMKRLIEDLLDLAKVEAGHLVLDKRLSNVEKVADEAIHLLTPMALQKSIHIEKAFNAPPPQTALDQERMLQVFSNLIGNAIKFSPDQGTIQVGIQQRDTDILIFVTDQGPGIPSNSIQKVFNRFWQAKETAHKGTGLGLAIAKGIVDTHGGKIWVESTPGEKTTFFVSLPKQGQEEASAA